MKRLISLLLALVIALGVAAVATAEEKYKLGDTMEDFNVTLSDGTAVSLYGVLAEKKAVLINFWASWCSPCKREFPYMQQAYDEMSDEIGIIALSAYPQDTDEIVLALKDDLGLTTLPMGLSGDLSQRFEIAGYPTSVMVDRNGVICYLMAGGIPDKNKFINLFKAFTGDDYSSPVLLNDIPTVTSGVEYPEVSVIEKTLGLSGGISAVIPTDKSLWPFVPSQDGTYLTASNGAVKDTVSKITLNVEAKEGEGLSFDYSVLCREVLDNLVVSVDGVAKKFYCGDVEWENDYVKFASDGTHTVEFDYRHGSTSTIDETSASVRAVSVISSEQVAALDAQAPVIVKPLEGSLCTVEPDTAQVKAVKIRENMPDGSESFTDTAIISGDALKLKIRIGADVDENVAFVADSFSAAILATLPFEDDAFIYEMSIDSLANGAPSPQNSVLVCSSAVDMQNCYLKSYNFFASEADIDVFTDMYKSMAEEAGYKGYEISWEYADGSPKLSSQAEPEPRLNADGTANYVIEVLDSDGKGVAGAMIQICTPETCSVAPTDENGIANHTAAPYPYEIHLLMAPAGYESDAQVYVMPENGGKITITLKKQAG